MPRPPPSCRNPPPGRPGGRVQPPLPPPPKDSGITVLPMFGGKQTVHVLDGTALEEPPEEELLARLRALDTWSRPILAQLEKPMYFKPEAWEIRCRRFR